MEKTEVQVISDELGFGVAHMMVELWGGKTLYVPDLPSPQHPIARDIGEDNLRQLCEIYGSQVIHLPKMSSARSQRQRRKARQLASLGMNTKDIADVLDVSAESVRSWLQAERC